MGEHKRNPVAIAAKRGELPPKKPKMSKAKLDKILRTKCQELFYKQLPVISRTNKRKGGAE